MDSDTVVSDQLTSADSHRFNMKQNSNKLYGGGGYGSTVGGGESSMATLTSSNESPPITVVNVANFDSRMSKSESDHFTTSDTNDVEVDENFWEEINQILQVHGIQRLNPKSMLVLPTSCAFSIKIILTQLLKDNDRRQSIIQDLLNSNTLAKNELSKQKEVTVRSQKTIREMENSLTRQKSKIKDLEEAKIDDVKGVSDKLYRLRDEHNDLKARCHQLDQMNKHLRLEVDRANRNVAQLMQKEEKRKSDNEKVFYQIKSHSSAGEKVSDKKILAMIDHYEGAIEKLKDKITSLAEKQKQEQQKPSRCDRCTKRDFDAGSESETGGNESYESLKRLNKHRQSHNWTSEENQFDLENLKNTVAQYKQLCYDLEKDLLHSSRKLKESENEKALMKIEQDSRFSTNELLYAEKRVKVLESLLRKNNIRVPTTVQVDNQYNKSSNSDGTRDQIESTNVNEIRYLNIETTRKYLKLFCDHLNVEDLEQVLPALRQIGDKNSSYLKMKKFVQEVTEIISSENLPSNLTPGNKRDGASRRSYNTCVQTLKLWAGELKLLQDLYQSINNMVSTLMPSQKILPLSEDLSVRDLQNFVDSITQENSKQLGSDATCADVKTLRDMVKHFQQLFDCGASLQGVYPRMNEVFTKLEESRNTINTFKDLLGLDINSTSTRTLIGAFEAVCREFNNRTYDQLKSLISNDDLQNITEKVRVHDEFFPEFESMAEELMQVLDVDTLDRVVPAVRTLKFISNRSY